MRHYKESCLLPRKLVIRSQREKAPISHVFFRLEKNLMVVIPWCYSGVNCMSRFFQLLAGLDYSTWDPAYVIMRVTDLNSNNNMSITHNHITTRTPRTTRRTSISSFRKIVYLSTASLVQHHALSLC